MSQRPAPHALDASLHSPAEHRGSASQRRTWFAFAAVITGWGSSYFFMKLSLVSFTPSGLVATRFSLAALLCFAVARALREPFPAAPRVLGFATVGLFMISGSNLLTVYAQKTVASGIAGVVHAAGSVWLAALGAFGLGGAKTPARAWPGILGGIAGVALMLWPEPNTAHADTLGVAALLLATFIFAGISLLQRRVQAAGPNGLFSQLSIQFAAGAAGATLISIFSGAGFTHAAPGPTALTALFFLIFVSSVGGFGGYAIVLRDWPLARAGSYAVINPVVAVLLGVALLDEELTARSVFGIAITLASVAWVQLGANSRKAPP